jgi:hypothetical protein
LHTFLPKFADLAVKELSETKFFFDSFHISGQYFFDFPREKAIPEATAAVNNS